MNSERDTSSSGFDAGPLLKNLTHKPGTYQMLDGEHRVIYVGKAKDLRRRVGSYFQGRSHDNKTMAMLKRVESVEVTVTRTETEALILEYNLIKQHKPRFNVLLSDDKSYPYIHVSTDHPYPRLSMYRGKRKKSGRLFGPYPSAGSVRETIGQLQKLFRLRLCEDSYYSNRSRPCLQYQIQRCTAPCVGQVSKSDYGSDVEDAMLFLRGRSKKVTASLVERMGKASDKQDYELAAQYRDQVAQLKAVESQQLVSRDSGDFDIVGIVFEHGIYCIAVMYFRAGRLLGSRNYFPRTMAESKDDEVIRAFLLQYYGGREAPREIIVNQAVPEAQTFAAMLGQNAGHRVLIKSRVRGDRARWLAMAETNARHGAAIRQKSEMRITKQLEALTAALRLDEVPQRLECFDVSHTDGKATVASCVVFGPEGPIKADYRRFNISGVTSGDDYAALAQAVQRRYARVKKGEAPIPDVLVVDGGRGQLNRAFGIIEELQLNGVQVIGVAKGQGRQSGREKLYLPELAQPIKLAPSSNALHLIQRLRDEAHRFAITGHRGRRLRQQSSSPLEDIKGLGPKRRRELLRQFGGLQAVSRASVDDLIRVNGISGRLATSIYEYFHAD
ncbi:MAG: excinuclease ABC subunit UvrC [Candidatus Rariloculaceae bacterium]